MYKNFTEDNGKVHVWDGNDPNTEIILDAGATIPSGYVDMPDTSGQSFFQTFAESKNFGKIIDFAQSYLGGKKVQVGSTGGTKQPTNVNQGIPPKSNTMMYVVVGIAVVGVVGGAYYLMKAKKK